MIKFTTTTKIQKKIGDISRDIKTSPYIATQRGSPIFIMLPYFEKSDEWLVDYMEEYELYKNKTKIEEELEESMNSGISNFKI